MLDENYQEQLEEIVKFSPKGRQTMLFSATMTEEVTLISMQSWRMQKQAFQILG